VLTAFYRWRGAWFYLPATLVALSRIATGSHWPSDIVISAIGSILVTLGLLALYAWLWRKFAPRLAPKLAAGHPDLISAA
jgi:membrane-associated phospholipid phosphatase